MYHVSIWTFSVLRVLIHYLYGSVIKMSSNFKPFKINQEYFCLTLIKLPFFFFFYLGKSSRSREISKWHMACCSSEVTYLLLGLFITAIPSD